MKQSFLAAHSLDAQLHARSLIRLSQPAPARAGELRAVAGAGAARRALAGRAPRRRSLAVRPGAGTVAGRGSRDADTLRQTLRFLGLRRLERRIAAPPARPC